MPETRRWVRFLRGGVRAAEMARRGEGEEVLRFTPRRGSTKMTRGSSGVAEKLEFFAFFIGEATIEGSMFSASKSSKGSGSLRRLVAVCMLDLDGVEGIDLRSGAKAVGRAGAQRQEPMSGQEVREKEGALLTVLIVLDAGELLDARSSQLPEGHTLDSHSGHDDQQSSYG